MFALLILPILVSGFIVLSINPYQKLKLHRYDGQLLYLKAAKVGLRYFIFVTIICLLLKDCAFKVPFTSIHFEPNIVTFIAKQLSAIEHKKLVSSDVMEASWLLALSIATIITSYAVSCVKACWIKFQDKLSNALFGSKLATIILLGKILKDSPLDHMFYESFANKRAIMITLKSRKVYIGMVNNLGEPSESEEPNQEISLVPAMSGYRDKDTLALNLKNNYEISSKIDCSIVIKVDQIDTVSWFNYEFYEDTNENIDKNNDDLDDSSIGNSYKDKCSDCREKTKFKIGRYSIMKND